MYCFPSPSLLQHGFEQLQSLVVNLSAYPSGKVSKATVLEKSEFAQYVSCTVVVATAESICCSAISRLASTPLPWVPVAQW